MWIPVKQQFKMGDTCLDKYYNYRFFMPDIRYGQIGIRNEYGSVEGKYVADSGKSKYQSCLRSIPMVLLEKNFKIPDFKEW